MAIRCTSQLSSLAVSIFPRPRVVNNPMYFRLYPADRRPCDDDGADEQPHPGLLLGRTHARHASGFSISRGARPIASGMGQPFGFSRWMRLMTCQKCFIGCLSIGGHGSKSARLAGTACGANANSKLTFQPDHSAGAGHGPP
jgi:hypothetical protein